MAFLDPVFNPVLLPVLNWSSFFGLLIITFVVSLIVTVAYKYLTNQQLMKNLKEQQKDFQQKMKDSRDNPENLLKLQKDAMKVNMDYMKHSFKPTLVTMLPILLIFGWMTAHLAYQPIEVGERYSITVMFADGVEGIAQLLVDNGTKILNNQTQVINSEISWYLKSEKGEHIIKIKSPNDEQIKKVIIGEGFKYEPDLVTFQNSEIKSIKINYQSLKPLNELFEREISIFGWQPGWLGIYIIFSIVFSMALRKVMNLY